MVPAQSLELTPMDGCFVRMGARDAILSGQSTFYIEMAETAAMLCRATPRSLVALDELGRGTATLDGEAGQQCDVLCVLCLCQLAVNSRCCCVLLRACLLAGAAIAAAVLDQLAHTTRCCGLFATHYHQLSAEHERDAQVAIMHMACAVAEQQQQPAAGAGGEQAAEAGAGGRDNNSDVAEVTFLYKLAAGVGGCGGMCVCLVGVLAMRGGGGGTGSVSECTHHLSTASSTHHTPPRPHQQARAPRATAPTWRAWRACPPRSCCALQRCRRHGRLCATRELRHSAPAAARRLLLRTAQRQSPWMLTVQAARAAATAAAQRCSSCCAACTPSCTR